MVSGFTADIGDTVRDTLIGLVWIVVAKDGEGGVRIRRNGVTAFASILNLKPVAGNPVARRCPATNRPRSKILA